MQFRAVRTSDSCVVSLKRFSAIALRLFVEEAKAGLRIIHPNLAPITRLFVDVPTQVALPLLCSLRVEGWTRVDTQRPFRANCPK